MVLARDPFEHFNEWYQQALKSDEVDPDAMALATATRKGKPSVRMVLYKGISKNGFLIYTNYESRKAIELNENPFAALVIYWPRCYRQIRIEGQMEKITAAESEQYFQTRSRESQVAACISQQSREIPDREYLLEQYAEFVREYEDKPIPYPERWGGFRLIPNEIEFWQGEEHRLHDRINYCKQAQGWKIVRLAP